MKSVLLRAALAAGLVASSGALAAPPPPPVYNWTGLYVGGNVGYSWGESDTIARFFNNTTGALLATGASSFDLDGWLAGLQLGNPGQSGRWVFGVEGDFQWTGQDGGTNFVCPATPGVLGPCTTITFVPPGAGPPSSTFNQSLEWFATLRARIGYTVTPTMLAYITGGLAVGNIESDGVIIALAGNGATLLGPFSDDETTWGWTIGAGIEAALSGNWTAKIEYLYIDFGSVSATGFNLLAGPPLRVTFDSDITDHILRLGINYRFAPGP